MLTISSLSQSPKCEDGGSHDQLNSKNELRVDQGKEASAALAIPWSIAIQPLSLGLRTSWSLSHSFEFSLA